MMRLPRFVPAALALASSFILAPDNAKSAEADPACLEIAGIRADVVQILEETYPIEKLGWNR